VKRQKRNRNGIEDKWTFGMHLVVHKDERKDHDGELRSGKQHKSLSPSHFAAVLVDQQAFS
jgi:hypothetical protein